MEFTRIYISVFLVVLGSAWSNQASTCLRPTPAENFSQGNFSGTWYYVAFNHLNPLDDLIYRLSRCTTLSISPGDSGESKFHLKSLVALLADITIAGTYIVPNPKKAIITENTKGLVGTYEVTFMCLDYTSYAAVYACREVAPGYTTEWIGLLVRDVSKYDEIIAKKELEKCYLELPIKSVKQLTKRSFNNCKGLLSGVFDLVGGLVGGITGVLGGLVSGLL